MYLSTQFGGADLDFGSPSWNDVSNHHFENEDMEEVVKDNGVEKDGECGSDIYSDSDVEGDWCRTDWSINASTPPLRRSGYTTEHQSMKILVQMDDICSHMFVFRSSCENTSLYAKGS